MAASLLQPDASRLDADYMTRALKTAGLIRDSRVTSVAAKPVGAGLVGDSFRFTLAYDGAEPGAPASVVGKFPAKDAVSRKSGSDHLLYLREVSFYRQMAHRLAIRTPTAIVAEIDPETHDFTLLFEDLGPARQGDQLAGCSVEDAAVAMREAAGLHAPLWGDPGLAELDWLSLRPAAIQPMILAALPAIIGLFRERYQGQLEPEFMKVVEELPRLQTVIGADHSTPRTIQHADFRLDNVLFEARGGTIPMATLDWQTVAHGIGATDVAYFLSAGVTPSDRRAHEKDLVRLWHEELVRRGVKDYPFEAAFTDYRRYTTHGVLMGVFSALSVERTERGDALFLKMTRGACEQALDLQTLSFWEG